MKNKIKTKKAEAHETEQLVDEPKPFPIGI